MAEIAIEVSDNQALSELQQLGEHADGFTSERKGMDGITLATVVMTLVPAVIGGIVKIYQAQQQAKKYIRVSVNGIEIQGVNEDKIVEILQAAQVQKTPKNEPNR